MAAPAPAAGMGGAGAAAAAAAAPAAAMGGAGGAPAAAANSRTWYKKIYDFISSYAGFAGAGIAEMFANKKLTLSDINRLVTRGEITYIPPQWVKDLWTRGAIVDWEYNNIITAGKRALVAAIAVIRNYFIYMSLYSRKKATAQTDTRLRAAAVRVFHSILLYHVYTYYKFAIRKPYENLAAEVFGLNVAADSQAFTDSGESVPHLEEITELSDLLNNQLIPAYSDKAEELGITAGGGAGAFSIFPELVLKNSSGVVIDPSESDDSLIAEAMERYISRAEELLDERERSFTSAAPAYLKDPSRDFKKALDAMHIRKSPNGSNGSVGILDAVRALGGAGAVAGAMAGNGVGSGNYGAAAALSVAGGGDGSIGPVLGLLADPLAGDAPSGIDILAEVAAAGEEAAAARDAAATDAAIRDLEDMFKRGRRAAGAGAGAGASSQGVTGYGGGSGWGTSDSKLQGTPSRGNRSRSPPRSGKGSLDEDEERRIGASYTRADAGSYGGAGAASSSGPLPRGAGAGGYGGRGGARRTRRRRHHKTRRHAHKNRKAKTHHRSHARKTSRRTHH